MTYRYSLDKSSKKFMCPVCRKKKFVKYVDNQTNQYLEDNCGRCDRESKCGYHLSPKGNQPITQLPINNKPILPTYHDTNLLSLCGKKYNTHNNFISFLKKHFCAVDIQAAIDLYFIGTSSHWDGANIFWQVDECMNVHAGKIMLYDPSTGSRVKKPYSHINWVHKVMEKMEFKISKQLITSSKTNCNTEFKDCNTIVGHDCGTFVLQQCLFGLHNLHDDTYKTIAIVESEKTAVIMSVFMPHLRWMATGSKSNFKEKLLKPLKGRTIIAYPDKSEYSDWEKVSKVLSLKGYDICCDRLLELKGMEDGSDLWDFLES